MEYSQQQIKAFQDKEKRISLQGFHRGICTIQGMTEENAWILANKRNEEMYQKYPFTSNTSTFSNKPVRSPINASGNDLCPDCGAELKYKEGIKNGKKWRGQFCQNKDCKKVVWLPRKEPQENIDRANFQDDQEDVRFKTKENEHFDNSLPPEYGG